MSESTLTLAFAGTPDLAATSLQKLLLENHFQINCVLTQPDRRAGRGRKLSPSAVKNLAMENGLNIEQAATPSELDPDNKLADVDVLVVVAFGMILPEAILNRPKYGSLNVHTSLLPRWRGAAPIQRAIEAGDAETGVSIMQMDTGLDTGDILLQKKCAIENNDTSGSLHDKLALLGAEGIVETLEQIRQGKLQTTPQDDSQANYAKKIHKSEAEIDWSMSASQIERKIRAFNPAPVCFTTLNGQDMRIWQAEVMESGTHTDVGVVIEYPNNNIIEVNCADGSLRLQKIQIPGKNVVDVKAFLNARPDFLQTRN